MARRRFGRIFVLVGLAAALSCISPYGIAHAYIDPGSGLPFMSSLWMVLGIIIAFLGGCLLFIKRFFLLLRSKTFAAQVRYRALLITCAAVLAAAALVFGGIMMSSRNRSHAKVIILGMDGLDPTLLEEFMSQGELPNFASLGEKGSFTPLATTNPPQSPVAWSSFATGLRPGGHGVFDFIARDPATYLPRLAIADIEPSPKKVSLGGKEIPLGRPQIVVGRKGTPFWVHTSKARIPTTILFCPCTFPPDRVEGRMLSGMGVPDLRGTEGTFSFYTTAELPEKEDTGGKVFQVKVGEQNLIETRLLGPKDTSGKTPRDAELLMKISVDGEARRVTIDVQDQRIGLDEGDWSDWCRLVFAFSPLHRVRGICRFYLKRVTPEFELYCSPVNFDPESPPFPISYPKGYSASLAREMGLYSTQGSPYDTWALNEGRLDEVAFLEHAQDVLREREAILRRELDRFQRGVLFCYFENPDVIQHTFWRFRDQEHPLYDPELAKLYGGVILRAYQRMDNILGEVMEKMDQETILLVNSDHGFNTFRRAVHLNAWLRENGFLFLKDDAQKGRDLLQDVDWSRTKAYSVGFGGIYINQKGREARGLVEPGRETEELKREIVEKLAPWQDSRNGQRVVHRVYTREEIFYGPYSDLSPDLLVGFEVGYRASWQTALGGVPEVLVEDNLKKWSGDHLFDHSLVPGVLLTNRKLTLEDPHLVDIAPTILELLGLEIPEDMIGRPLLARETP